MLDCREDTLAKEKTRVESISKEKKTSDTRLERIARCSAVWSEVQEQISEARTKAYEDKAKAKATERTWQTIQSALSYLREGMKRDIV
jgi:hypothetical protein